MSNIYKYNCAAPIRYSVCSLSWATVKTLLPRVALVTCKPSEISSAHYAMTTGGAGFVLPKTNHGIGEGTWLELWEKEVKMLITAMRRITG